MMSRISIGIRRLGLHRGGKMTKTESLYVAAVLLVVAGVEVFLGQNVALLARWHPTAISIGLSFGALGAMAYGFAVARG